MSDHLGALDIPPSASADPKAVEIARVWAVNGTQEVRLRTATWKDPAAWGLILVELASDVANTYAQIEGRDRGEVLARIKAGFDADWPSEYDTTTGSINSTDESVTE